MNITPLEKSLNRQAYFPALTGVRGFATYLVFIQHNRPNLNIITENFARDYLNTGHTALTLFFVLSGFLITYRYAEGFEQHKIKFGHYFGRRFARILPLYFILSVIILVWQHDFNPWHWFLNLTLLKGFFNVERSTGLFQGWTLTVEETFYLLAPLLFIYFRKSALLTLLTIFSAGVIMVLIAHAFGSESFFVDIEFMVIYTFAGRCFEFYCGYKLATILQTRNPGIIKSSTGYKYTLAGALGIFLIYLGLNFSGIYELRIWFNVPFEVVLNSLFLPIAIAVFFYGLITEVNLTSRILASRPVRLIGRSSYAFYLIHVGLYYEFFYFHLSQNKFIIFLALNISAVILYLLVEEPINRYLVLQLNKRYHKN